MIKNISHENWLLAVKRWHPENPERGKSPGCSYVCNACSLKSFIPVDFPCRASSEITDKIKPKAGNLMLRIIMADGLRLDYVQSVDHVPTWKELEGL